MKADSSIHDPPGSKQVTHSQTGVDAVDVFYSYSHADITYREQLEKHLSLLERQGIIKGWHDRRIGPGDEWEGDINEHLNRARLVLLLISSDFIASKYCYDIEMTRALELHSIGITRVIPILLRPVDWNGAPFAKLQFLPENGTPVSQWSQMDDAFRSIAQAIRKVLNPVSPSSDTTSSAQAGQWRIQIEGTLEDFDRQRLEDVFDRLRGLSGDLRMELKRVERGSIILVLEGTKEGFDRLNALFREGRLSHELKVRVESLNWCGLPTSPANATKVDNGSTDGKHAGEPEPVRSGRRGQLYVGNLSFSVTSEDLKKLFSRFGRVRSAVVVQDRDTGRSKGFGFVEMDNVDEAIGDLNGRMVGGRPLVVNEARPREGRRYRGGEKGGNSG
jgi:hypothetical protein